MKRGKKHFSQNTFSHPKKKVYNKYFDNSNIRCYNCNKKGHYARNHQAKKRGKGRFLASIAIVDETTQKNASNEKETRREYHLVSVLSRSAITSVETWVVDSGASKHMTRYKSSITDLKEKNFTCKVELGDNTIYSIKGVGSTSFQLSSMMYYMWRTFYMF